MGVNLLPIPSRLPLPSPSGIEDRKTMEYLKALHDDYMNVRQVLAQNIERIHKDTTMETEINELREIVEEQGNLLSSLARSLIGDQMIFVNPIGHPFDPTVVSSVLSRYRSGSR